MDCLEPQRMVDYHQRKAPEPKLNGKVGNDFHRFLSVSACFVYIFFIYPQFVLETLSRYCSFLFCLIFEAV